MVDTPPDEFPEPHDATPPAAEERQASSAIDAAASQAKVIDIAGSRRKKAVDVSATESASSPPSPKKANAPPEGAGGKPKKAERTVDWGVYNYLKTNFVLIYPTDTAWDGAKRKVVKISNMAHMYGADLVKMWKASPDRRSVDEEDLVFDPTMTCDPDKAINLYDGLAIQPRPCKPEECAVMLELLRHLCSRCATTHVTIDEVMQWVLRWLALPLQKPGAKPRTALVFHGPQGTGKNLFFDAVRLMYGKYGVMVGQNELEEKYNGWLSAKQLIIGNEVVSRQELYHNKNRLKWVITEEKIPIRTMHQDTRWENNFANVVFLSNEQRPLILEIDDRRYLVVYTPTAEDGDLYLRVRAFLDDDGVAKFMYYLMNYDLGDFHEHTKPLMTEAKQDLIEQSMQPGERFITEWTQGYLNLPMQVCSAEQLYRAFRRWCDLSGEKWPPPQSGFTSGVKRWAIEHIERDEEGNRLAPCLDYKVINLRDASSARKSVRCWLPRGTGPLNGVSEGDWAGASVEAFELALSRFMRANREGSDESVTPKA